MKKVSFILAFLILLTLISGCSKRTSSDIATDKERESETVEVSETEETKEIKETEKYKNKEETNRKENERETEEDIRETLKNAETDESAEIVEIDPPVTPEPSAGNENTTPPSGGGKTAPSAGNDPSGNDTPTTQTPAQTTKQPAETTKQSDPPKPAEDPTPQSDSNLPATVEILSYKGGNIAVVNKKKEKGKDCSVKVSGTYKNADGSSIRTETKIFSGLSNNDNNYFIFNPGITFTDFTCVTTEINDGAIAYSKFYSFASTGTANIPANSMSNIPDSYLEYLTEPNVGIKTVFTGEENLYIYADILVFDNTGKPIYVGDYHGAGGASVSGRGDHFDFGIPIKCEKKGNKYELPSNLTGELGVIVALTGISDSIY